MATRIVHFGFDDGVTLLALAQSGYEVAACGASVPKLKDALQQADYDAILVSEGDGLPCEELPYLRSLSPAPLVLFRGAGRKHCPSGFDLVVRQRTQTAHWLKSLADLIKHSRARRGVTNSACDESSSLIKHSDGLIKRSLAIRREAKSLRRQSASSRKESARQRAVATRNLAASQREHARQEHLATEKAPAKRNGSRLAPRKSAAARRPGGPVRVLIVDDYQPWRQAVRSLLERHTGLQIVGSVTDGIEAVGKADELKPDLVLLDIGLPRLNGIDAAMRIQQAGSGTKILFVTTSNSAAVAQHALSGGADGYVLKSNAFQELWRAIQTVLEGRRYVSSALELDEA
jgi:CheY-like chemotaxis protein